MGMGIIVRVWPEKGFGFVRSDEPEAVEYFFHRTSVIGTDIKELRSGDRVEFTPEVSDKGPRAGEVRRSAA
jgi:cold shock CspA family protein